MKKTSLIILLLIAVVFYMTSCNGSTSSPSSSGSNSNTIPGVKEDPNVPNSSEFINSDPKAAAKASEVLSSLQAVAESSKPTVHHYEMSEITKYSAIAGAKDNNEQAVTGALELRRNSVEDYNSSSRGGASYPSVQTEVYNGEIKIGGDTYKAVNFEVKYTYGAEGGSSAPSFSGKVLKNGVEVENPQSVLSYVPIYNDEVFNRELVSRSQTLSESYADSSLIGNIGYQMNMAEENKGHQINIVNFTNIKGGHSLTAKLSYDFETSEKGYKPSNIKFDYLSLDGTYYTPEFALTINSVVELLTHIG